jgi:hypothetical protein
MTKPKCEYCGDTGLIIIRSDGRPQLYGGRPTVFPPGLSQFFCPNCTVGRRRRRETRVSRERYDDLF